MLAPFVPVSFPEKWRPSAEQELRLALDSSTVISPNFDISDCDNAIKLLSNPKTPEDYYVLRYTIRRQRGSGPVPPPPESASITEKLFHKSIDDIAEAEWRWQEKLLTMRESAEVVSRALQAVHGIEAIYQLNFVLLREILNAFSLHIPDLPLSMKTVSFSELVRSPEANIDMATILRLEPEFNIPWVYERGSIYLARGGDAESAAELIDRALKVDPENHVYHYYKGAWLWLHQVRKHNIQLRPPRSTLPIAERVPAECLERITHFINKAAADHPLMPESHFLLAHMYLTEDQEDLARQFYDAGCKMDELQLPYLRDPDQPTRAMLKPILQP